MRHKSKRHNFHRRPGPRVALIRGYVYSLITHGRIKTTVVRCKEVRRHVEKAITLARKGTLHSRRLLLSKYPNEDVVGLLAGDLSKRFAKREGGYTRIIKVGARGGDQSDMAFLEFVDYVPKAQTGDETVKAADPVIAARLKANAGERLRLRKSVRKIKNVSRREARA
ncbi:MAG: 50S ribosomal protein L17 [Bdellovibrionales bacterium]